MLLVLGGLGFARFTESAVGIVVLVAVVVWWGVGLRDGLTPWVILASALLLVSHVAATVLSYAPGEVPPDAALLRRWAVRGAMVFGSVPVLYLGAVAVRGVEPPAGTWVLGLAAASAAMPAASLILSRSRTD